MSLPLPLPLPHRLPKSSQPTSNVAMPIANKQSVPTPPVPTGNRSYSPASGPGSLSKSSPTTGAGLNTSPHRNELSPAAKSPLLGTAPPGLLPPPDKGNNNFQRMLLHHRPDCFHNVLFHKKYWGKTSLPSFFHVLIFFHSI